MKLLLRFISGYGNRCGRSEATVHFEVEFCEGLGSRLSATVYKTDPMLDRGSFTQSLATVR